MKKLDNNVLRKLILETIEESSILSEGKKKKKRLKEVEPVPQASDDEPLRNPEQDVTGMEAEPQPEDFGINPEQFQAALEATRSGDQMKEIGGWSILGKIADQIKDAIKKKEGNQE